jgi:hypothetical protein
MDLARKQALALAQANANPNASFADRVAHFDHMAQISQKRKFYGKTRGKPKQRQ